MRFIQFIYFYLVYLFFFHTSSRKLGRSVVFREKLFLCFFVDFFYAGGGGGVGGNMVFGSLKRATAGFRF